MPSIIAIIVIAILVKAFPPISLFPVLVWAFFMGPIGQAVLDFGTAHGIKGPLIDAFPIYLTWFLLGTLVVYFASRWAIEQRATDFNCLVLSIGLPAVEVWGLRLTGHSFGGG
jgi:hypothetical protein